jgi:hypothetical protein
MRTGTIVRHGVKPLLALGLVLSVAQLAGAQTRVGATGRVHEGQYVWVTAMDGGQYEGRVVAVEPGGIDLSADGLRRSLPIADIRRVETRDSLVNGAVVGGIIGGASMVCLVTWAIQLSDEGQGVSRRDIFTAIRFSALAAAGGALAGAGIDRAIGGRQTLYLAPGTQAALAFRPMLSRSGAGAAVTVAW